MLTQVTCSKCSGVISIPNEWSGKRAACPHCRTPFLVPGQSIDRPPPARFGVAAAVVIALAVAAACGIVIGHRKGRSDDKQELRVAESTAQSLTEKLSAAQVALTDARSVAANRKAERDALAAELGDRERILATVQQREAVAAAEVRKLEGKLSAALAVAALGNRRDEEKPAAEWRDLLKLQGAWTPTKFTVNGSDLAPQLAANATQFECQSDKLVSQQVGGPTGLIKLRPGKSPPEIDLTPGKEFNGGQTIEGSYTFEGEKVILCFARAGAVRPTKFEAADKVALLWLERAKK